MLEAQFTRAFYHEGEKTADIVLTLAAPKMEGTVRPPLCILAALDVSGSMAGDKLAYAKTSILKMVDHLSPRDRMGLMTFNDRSRVLIEPCLMTAENKTRMAVEVGKIQASGGTNIYDALVQGFETLDHADLSDSTISRVVLYSDGEANQGLLKDAEGLAKTVQQYRKKASVSAFGYGLGADQLLMGALAEVGQGNYAHITAPDDSLTVFARELGGLLSTYAQDIKVSVKVCNEFGPLQVITDLPFTTEEGGSEVTLDLGSLLAEESRHIVLRVGLKGDVVPRETKALEIRYSCRTLDGAGEARNEGGQTPAKILRVRGTESGEVNKDLSRIVAMAELQQVQKRADAAVRAGQHQEAQAMFVNYSANLSADHFDLQEGANRMAGLYTETAYNSQEGRAAVATTKGVTRRRSAVLLAHSSNINLVSDAPIGASVYNSAQEAMTKAFLTSLHEKHMAAVPVVPPTKP